MNFCDIKKNFYGTESTFSENQKTFRAPNHTFAALYNFSAIQVPRSDQPHTSASNV